MIYGHGDDNYISKEAITSNFSSNVWFGADMTALYEHLTAALPATVSYPEPNADSLVKALSKKTGIAASRITVCNGSTEAFYLLALAFRSQNSLIAVPSFSEYEDACRIHTHRLHFAKQQEFETTLKRVKPDLAWICLPNNPDGFCFSRKQIEEWLAHFPKTTFVIDQAYADFTLEKTFPAKAVTKFDNLVLVHSLTKSHKIPGLRLGYVMSNKRMTDRLNSLKMPWSVNMIAIEAGKYLLEHGVAAEDFNSYGSRRGNDRVMTRGTFANVRIKNLMAPGTEGGVTKYQPSGEQMSIYDAAIQYAEHRTPLIVFAGQEYGTGSSRDWAAKGTALLGVKAVVAQSFERIHRSNLVGMGVLPLQFKEGTTAQALKLDGTETFDVLGLDAKLKPQQDLTLRIRRASGQTGDVSVRCRIDTPIEIDYYRHGGILPFVLRQLVAEQPGQS